MGCWCNELNETTYMYLSLKKIHWSGVGHDHVLSIDETSKIKEQWLGCLWNGKKKIKSYLIYFDLVNCQLHAGRNFYEVCATHAVLPKDETCHGVCSLEVLKFLFCQSEFVHSMVLSLIEHCFCKEVKYKGSLGYMDQLKMGHEIGIFIHLGHNL